MPDAAGKAIPGIPIVFIDPSHRRKAYTIAHELEHTRGVVREYMANYNSVIKLWESDIPYLKYAAFTKIVFIVCQMYPSNYDCTEMLVRYAL